MTFPKQIKKIIWAVDAFAPHPESLKNIAKHVGSFAKLFGASVELVYVYSIPKMLMDRKSFDAFQQPYLTQAQKNLEATAKFLPQKPSKVTVLSSPASGKSRDEIAALLSYATKSKADLITLASHGRNAVVRFFLGSFAESLLHKSRKPLLIIGPHHKHKAATKPSRALFPTALDKRDAKIFPQILQLAGALKLSMHLVHGMINEFVPAVLSDAYLIGGFYPATAPLFQETLERRKADLHDWLSVCKKRKINAKGEIFGSGGLVSDVITKAAARGHDDFIILNPDPTGPSPGSITRKVIRESALPVLLWK